MTPGGKLTGMRPGDGLTDPQLLPAPGQLAVTLGPGLVAGSRDD